MLHIDIFPAQVTTAARWHLTHSTALRLAHVQLVKLESRYGMSTTLGMLINLEEITQKKKQKT